MELRNSTLLMPIIASVGLFSTTGLAQDTGKSTDAALQRLNQALEAETALSPETREAFRAFADAIHRDLEAHSAPPVLATPEPQLDMPKQIPDRWVDLLNRTSVGGDLRLRHETTFSQDDRNDRHRERMRLRLWLKHTFSSELTIGAGVRTGNADDPNSPYVTLGSGFDDFDVSIDQLYVDYRPDCFDGGWLKAGKFKDPRARNPVYGEVVWDGDVNPDGAAIGYSWTGEGLFRQVDAHVGGYTLLEDSATDDVWMMSAQISAKLAFSESVSGRLAIGYDHYGNATPDGNTGLLAADNRGNATVDLNSDGSPDEFASDFGILNPIASVTFTSWEMPVTLSGEYILNTRALGDDDQGWALGASIGKTRKKGDWKAYYQWQVVERDAVFSAWVQDDFLSASNFRGHIFGAQYMLMDQLQFHLWGLMTTQEESFVGPADDDDKWRVRADLTFKF